MLNTDTIEITKNDFAPLLHWCLIKFIVDPGSRMGIGGRADKIGGFIDRWSNQCVNWVMFNHLLRNEEFNIDPDYFFYSAKSAKKSSDVIGLKGDNGKVVPLSYFETSKWVQRDNTPFIEVKTLRKDQSCAGLGMPQYDDDHYFVYVESEFDELYLFNFFTDFLEKKIDIKMDNIYVKDNSENIILNPSIDFPNKIASLRLLGTYKGSQLKNQNLEFPEGKNPRYIDTIEKLSESEMFDESKRLYTPMNDGRFLYNPDDEKKNEFLPIYTDGRSIKIVHKEKKTLGSIIIEVNKNCFLNEYQLEKGFYKIFFKRFLRSSKETEIFNHKSTYDSSNHKYDAYPNDCTDELIIRLRDVFNSEN